MQDSIDQSGGEITCMQNSMETSKTQDSKRKELNKSFMVKTKPLLHS